VRRLQHLTDAALAHASLDELLEDLLARIRDGVRVDSAAVVLHEPDAPASSAAQPASAQELGMALEVPLLVGRERIGALRVGRERYLPFSNEERALLGLVADRTAVAIARAQLYEREHGIAETLQRTLLPDKLPEVPGVDLAARYLPGGAGMVGGDWYDVVPLPDGGLALLMGDVAGRGVGAAALMGQLRIAARAYAFEDPSPGYVLERLNRLVGTMGEECMATAVYGVLHRGAQKLRLAAAAHPPPVVIMPDGGATALEDLRGLPLGALPDTRFAETHVDFEPGSSVLFYTDGLIERRGEPLRVGLDRLLHAIPAGSDAPAICDRIIEGLLPAGPTADDAALLVVQTRRRAAR
jgi:serine phosphatase RsbU (regulator of sigma subunit)